MSPKISIVMPILNRAHTVEKAIRSVLDQHYPNLELIVIDGGSTDGTVAIIERYAAHITYWHSQQDGSPAIGINSGIQKATGDFVALLMADDWYEPHTLQKVAETAELHPDVDMITVGGQIVYYDEKTQCYVPKHVYVQAPRMRLNFQNICFDITSAICCRFISKSLYDRIGLLPTFDAEGVHILSGDKELLMRAVLYGVKDVFVPQLCHNYLASPDSSTFGGNKRNIRRLCVEHRVLALTYLREKQLSFYQRWQMHYWYNDQTTRLLLFQLLDGEFRAAWQTNLEALRRYSLLWPVAFCYVTAKISLKRGWRLLCGQVSR